MASLAQDHQVRLRAFAFLEEQRLRFGDVVPYKVLKDGFQFEGERVPLMGPQGIFKPKVMELPLSITTVPVVEGQARPYEDDIGADGLLAYRYRGTDPQHRDNVGLRRLMESHAPLIYFHGIVKGQYAPAWPVHIVGDDPDQLLFRVEIEAAQLAHTGVEPLPSPLSTEPQRSYSTILAVRRLHQAAFRERVLRAYRERCAVCSLRHVELLDAAHILPDGHPRGLPEVPNGLALCKLHHAAFDQHLIGVRPDLVIEVRASLLDEEDGPMLKHGLQGFHLRPLLLPKASRERPREEFIAERYALFRKVG